MYVPNSDGRKSSGAGALSWLFPRRKKPATKVENSHKMPAKKTNDEVADPFSDMEEAMATFGFKRSPNTSSAKVFPTLIV
jgi:hypothetical protein